VGASKEGPQRSSSRWAGLLGEFERRAWGVPSHVREGSAGALQHRAAAGRAEGSSLWGSRNRQRRSRATQLLTNGGEAWTQARGKETVVAHFDKALGQDVLQETVDELLGREGAQGRVVGVGGAVTECNPAVFEFEDAGVGDGDAEDVRGEILERVPAIADRLAVYDPRLSPHTGGNLGETTTRPQGITELGAEDRRERLDGEQEVGVLCRQPGVAVHGGDAGGDEIMDVRMEGEVASPRMQHADQAQLSTEETWVAGQGLDSLGRGAEEQVVKDALVTARQVAQYSGQGEGEHKVGGRQKQVVLRDEPFLGVRVLALGAMAITTRMVDVARLAAVGAIVDLTAERGCAALLDGTHRLEVTRQHPLAKAGAISWAVQTEDLGEFYHTRQPITRSMACTASSSASRVRWV